MGYIRLEQPSDKVSVEPATVTNTRGLLLLLDSLPHSLIAVNDILASPEISLLWRQPLGLLCEFPAENHDQIEWDTEITSDEGLILESANEDIKVLGESDKNAPEESKVGSVNTAWSAVWHLIVGNTLGLSCTVEVDVSDEDGDPGQQTEDGDEVDKVTENGLRVVADVHEGKSTESSREGERPNWDTTGISLSEDCGSVSLKSETVDGSGSDVQVGVRGREDEDQDAAVQESWENVDSGDLNGSDEWRGSGRVELLLGSLNKEWVVIGDDHTEEEDGKTVEKEDTVEGELDSAWDGLSWILSFSDSHTDKLSTEVGENSVDHGGPETQELSERANLEIRSECTRVLPVSESFSVAIWSTAKGKNEREQD